MQLRVARKQLALAKISRPRLHDVLPRARLFALLDEACSRPAVWLCAQPGAGKTTLIASWLEARKRPGIWYQVDAADADPASFVYHLCLAAQPDARADKGSAGKTLPLRTPGYLQDLRGFARRCWQAKPSPCSVLNISSSRCPKRRRSKYGAG